LAFVRFSHDRSNSDLMVVSTDGATATRVATGRMPTWSPDGRKLAYLTGNSYDQINVMNADGSEQRALATGLWPDWSPDGTKIVFIHRDAQTGAHNLAVINADGSGLTLLKGIDSSRQCSTPDAYQPTWSPNGQRIAFGTSTDQDEAVTVCTMNADGSGIRPLTADPLVVYVYGRPAWSPDGSRIAVGALEWLEGQPQTELVVSYPTDQPGDRQVLFRAPPNWGGAGMHWTADGMELVFSHAVRTSGVRYIARLSALTLATGAIRQLLPERADLGDYMDWEPAVSRVVIP
jgi:hypothetical protein